MRHEAEKIFAAGVAGAVRDHALGLPGTEGLRQGKGHQPFYGNVLASGQFGDLLEQFVRKRGQC